MSLRFFLRSRTALVLALLADFLLWGGPHRPHDAFPTGFWQAAEAQAAVNRDWLDVDGVVGTAIGVDARGHHVVKVYLATPGAAALPATIAGVQVVTEVTGRFTAGAGWSAAEDDGGIDRKARFPRPVPIGVSSGHAEVTAGTIGARVTDGAGVFALSNNHVFAASNGGRSGDPVFQPGRADGGGAEDDAVARLHDFEPILMCRVGICIPNAMDAAVAATSRADLGRGTPRDGYGAPRSEIAEAEIGMKVQKYGRTTGHTKGRVSGIHATVDVGYGSGGAARFRDQIVISGGGFSGPGDSGSLVVTDGVLLSDRRPVGLLFAGSSTSTLANPIGPVLERFGVTIDGDRSRPGGLP